MVKVYKSVVKKAKVYYNIYMRFYQNKEAAI